MRLYLYALLGALGVFILGIGALSLATPTLPQQTITKTLDPAQAFTQPVPMPATATAAPPSAPTAGATEAAATTPAGGPE